MNLPFRRKIATGILVAALLAPSFLLLALPKPAAAQTDCLSALLGLVGIGTAGKAIGGAVKGVGSIGGILAVPTIDAANLSVNTANLSVNTANLQANSTTAAATTGATIERCVVEPLVVTAARSLLDNFTRDMVNWINSGFQGNPLFVTDPAGFFGEAGNEAIGSFISNLGGVGQLLCGPFDMQLRLSLGLYFGSYGSGYEQYIGCRLTDIEQNIQRSFTGGAFGANGWQNWLSLTVAPQNNIYGGFLQTTSLLDTQLVASAGITGQELSWGHGFLPFTSPDGKTTTPGTVIENQLANTLGEPVRQVGVARDLDAIVGALMNQLIGQMVGGLTGVIQNNGGGYGSATSNADALVQSAEQQLAYTRNAQTLEPGLLATGQTPQDFCAAFSQTGYGVKQGTSPTDPTTLVFTNYTIVTDTTNNGKPYQKTAPSGAHPTKADGSQWTIADYNAANAYCANLTLTSPVATATGAVAENLTNGITNNLTTANNNITAANGNTSAQTPNEMTGNIALNKDATQSSTYVDRNNNGFATSYQASNAVDGAIGDYSVAITDLTEANPWWQVDLSTDPNRMTAYTVKNISEVDLVGRTAYLWQSDNLELFISSCPFDSFYDTGTPQSSQFAILSGKVAAKTAGSVTNIKGAVCTFFDSGLLPSATQQSNGTDVITGIPAGVVGPYIRVQKTAPSPYSNSSYWYLSLDEVRVFGTQTSAPAGSAAAGAAGAAAAATPVLTVTPATSAVSAGAGARAANGAISPPTSFAATVNADQTGLTGTVSLLKKNAVNGTFTEESFGVGPFSSVLVSETQVDGSPFPGAGATPIDLAAAAGAGTAAPETIFSGVPLAAAGSGNGQDSLNINISLTAKSSAMPGTYRIETTIDNGTVKAVQTTDVTF